MKNPVLIAGTALVALAAPALALAAMPGARPGGPGPKAMPDITRAEVVAQVKEHFAKVDANKDGAITMDEIQAYHDARRAERLDAMFKAMDANGDGAISRAEFEAAHAERGPRAGMKGPMGARPMGDAPDAPPPPPMAGRMAPGMKGMGMMGGGMRGGRFAPHDELAIGGRMLRMADANKDGKVTLAEATQAALAHFDKMDANKDGVVTAQERRAAMRARRGAMPPAPLPAPKAVK